MYASIIRLPLDRITPEAEKKEALANDSRSITMPWRRQEYLKSVKQTLDNPEAIQNGVRHLSTSYIWF
jgi:hypothetical protein